MLTPVDISETQNIDALDIMLTVLSLHTCVVNVGPFFFFFFKCFKLKVWPCLKKMLIQIRGINISPVRKALKQYQTLQRVLLHPD